MKIQQLKQKNVLIKILNAETLKEVKGLITKPGKTAYLVAEIVDVGDKADANLAVGQQVLVHAQSLSYSVDAPQLNAIIEDKKAEYFIIFDEQVLAILEEDDLSV